MVDEEEDIVVPVGNADSAATALSAWATQLQRKASVQARENIESKREKQTEEQQEVEEKEVEATKEKVPEVETNAGLSGEEPPDRDVDQGTYLNIKA